MSSESGQASLAFPGNDAGEEEGLGHAGIETYKDAPYESVARECGQNSADARVGTPVELRFDVLEIPASDYPPLSSHLAAVTSCLRQARKARDEKGVEFFTRASEMLQGPKLKILRISDYNTKGLVGPAVSGTPFHSLVKATGISSKEMETSGGSFGIGKNAAFAVSELQTVFYSTVYKDDDTGEKEFLAQGKTILASHVDAEGNKRRATGYWGRVGFAPIPEISAVPQWLRREEIGTSVFVVGFRHSDDWKDRIAASLMQNFFCAVHRNEIRFLIDNGSIEINHQTLPALFADPQIVAAADQSVQREDFDFAQNLFRCLISGDSVRKEFAIDGLGRIGLTILMEDRLPKRVMIVRNGMAITGSLEHFGDKFSRFPMYREFVALVEPLDPVGSALIKRLENPRHDALSAERIPDARKRREANQAMRTLARSIRAAIKELALPEPADQIVLDELAEFFAHGETAQQPPKPGAEENPETFTYEPATRKRRPPEVEVTGGKGDAGGASGGGGRRGGGAAGYGHRKGRGRGGSGSVGGMRSVELSEFRNTLPAQATPVRRRLYFTPRETCTVTLHLRATGLDTPESVGIASADLGRVERGNLQIDVRTGERQSVEVRLAEPYDGPLELVATTQSPEE
jgi:hypothetical protein